MSLAIVYIPRTSDVWHSKKHLLGHETLSCIQPSGQSTWNSWKVMHATHICIAVAVWFIIYITISDKQADSTWMLKLPCLCCSSVCRCGQQPLGFGHSGQIICEIFHITLITCWAFACTSSSCMFGEGPKLCIRFSIDRNWLVFM